MSDTLYPPLELMSSLAPVAKSRGFGRGAKYSERAPVVKSVLVVPRSWRQDVRKPRPVTVTNW